MQKGTLSINQTHQHLDQAGKANAAGFQYVSDLQRLLLFELEENNRCRAVGQVWSRELYILMGKSALTLSISFVV